MLTFAHVMTAVATSSSGLIGEAKRPPAAQRTTTCVESSEDAIAVVRSSPSATSVVFSTATVTRCRPPKSSVASHAWADTGPNATSVSHGPSRSIRCAFPATRQCTLAVNPSAPIATHCSFTRSCVCGLPAA